MPPVDRPQATVQPPPGDLTTASEPRSTGAPTEVVGSDREPAPRFVGPLLGIAAVGFVLRLGYTLALRDANVMSDGYHYATSARWLADGHGYLNPLAGLANGGVPDGVHPPVWTTVLGGAAKLGFGSTVDFRVVAAIVGTLTVVVIGLGAREAFGPRVGLVAAGLAALYPNLWLYEHELVSEPPALLGLATLIWLTYRFRRRPGPWAAVLLGLTVAVCALTRSELILLSVLLVVPTVLAVRSASVGRRAGWLVLAGIGCLALIGPWFAYNTTRFEERVPLSAGLGGAMAAGNCPHTYDPANPNFAYYEFACVIFSPTTSSDPSVSDLEQRANTLRFIGAHKPGFALTASARVARTFSAYAPFQQVQLESERGTETWVLTLALLSYWALLPLAVYGAVVARRRKVPIYPLLGLVVVVIVAVIPTIGAVRYRAPAEIALVMLAAVGTEAVVGKFVARRRAARGDGRNDPTAPADTDRAALETVDR